MYRQSRTIILVLIFILAWSITTSSAQSDTFIFINESNVEIDRQAVEQAAQPLIDQYRAEVAVYAVVTGSKRDFTERLTADGLTYSFTGTRHSVLAIYIATEEQYSEIRWGSEFEKIDGGKIRSNSLNPSLRNRNFTRAFVDTLQAVADDMGNPLIGIQQFLSQLLSEPVFWVFVAIMLFAFISRKFGFSGGSSSSYDYSGDTSWSSSDSSSSWDSGDSGGGSDGGSWDD